MRRDAGPLVEGSAAADRSSGSRLGTQRYRIGADLLSRGGHAYGIGIIRSRRVLERTDPVLITGPRNQSGHHLLGPVNGLAIVSRDKLQTLLLPNIKFIGGGSRHRSPPGGEGSRQNVGGTVGHRRQRLRIHIHGGRSQ